MQGQPQQGGIIGALKSLPEILLQEILRSIETFLSDTNKLAKRGHCDSIVLIILTHGMTNVIFGVDGVPSELQTGICIFDIVDLLANNGYESLESKPKLLFMQACRSGACIRKLKKVHFVTDPCRQPSVCEIDRGNRCRCYDDHGRVEIARRSLDEPDMAPSLRKTAEGRYIRQSVVSKGAQRLIALYRRCWLMSG